MLLNRSRIATAPRCDATKRFGEFRRKVETKRTVVLKDHVNKLAAIGTAEVKEVTDLLKELDEIHRDIFKSLTSKVSSSTSSSSSSTAVEPDSIFE